MTRLATPEMKVVYMKGRVKTWLDAQFESQDRLVQGRLDIILDKNSIFFLIDLNILDLNNLNNLYKPKLK